MDERLPLQSVEQQMNTATEIAENTRWLEAAAADLGTYRRWEEDDGDRVHIVWLDVEYDQRNTDSLRFWANWKARTPEGEAWLQKMLFAATPRPDQGAALRPAAS